MEAKLALALALVSLVVSVTLYFLSHTSVHQREIRRAFEGLETEFDDLRGWVQSQMGRISRLKRSTLEVARQEAEPDDVSASVPAPEGDVRSGLNPRQQAIQDRILRRRMKQ